jgi:hypothetical protein
MESESIEPQLDPNVLIHLIAICFASSAFSLRVTVFGAMSSCGVRFGISFRPAGILQVYYPPIPLASTLKLRP